MVLTLRVVLTSKMRPENVSECSSRESYCMLLKGKYPEDHRVELEGWETMNIPALVGRSSISTPRSVPRSKAKLKDSS